MKKLSILLILSCGFAVSAFAGTGKITGKLTYPSEFIPPELILCVQKSGGKTVCSNHRKTLLRKAKINFRLNHSDATYRIKLPSGKYYLYATFPPGKAPTQEMEGLKAYYNEFVKCGMRVECRSKKRIAIRVRSGRTVKEITVGDWY